MQTNPSQKITLAANKFDEMILVVKRTHLFSKTPAWTGLKKVDFNEYLDIVQEHQEYIPRGLAENDPTYKQIIPYLVFRHNNAYFLMQRKGSSSEQRLANKYTLGIGGHLRKEDIHGTSIFEWAEREFHEEVAYSGTFTITPLGIINDDATLVGQVHIGFVLLLTGDSADISIKSELQSGQLVPLSACSAYQDELEGWSSYVVQLIQEEGL